MIGMAKKMNAMTGNENVPPVMVAMGELAALVQTVETMLEAQETKARIDDKGVVWPSLSTLYSVMALQSEFNPRMLEIIREMTGLGDDHHAIVGQGSRKPGNGAPTWSATWRSGTLARASASS